MKNANVLFRLNERGRAPFPHPAEVGADFVELTGFSDLSFPNDFYQLITARQLAEEQSPLRCGGRGGNDAEEKAVVSKRKLQSSSKKKTMFKKFGFTNLTLV